MKEMSNEIQNKSSDSALKVRKDSTDDSDSALDFSNKAEFTEIPLKRRGRKSSSQLEVLKQEFEQEQDWCRAKVVEISDQTHLSQVQVYK